MKRQLVWAAASVVLASLAPGASAALLAVDVNDRTAVSDPDNTVAGFLPFTLSGTTAAVGSTTQAVGAYTVSVTAVNAAGAAQGGIDDRDRTLPTTAPTLNQLYDDFIFTAAGVGAGGGVDLAISGGALTPNTPYLFSVYAYDNDSSGQTQPRSAVWLDGNNLNAPVLATSFVGGASPVIDNQYRFTGIIVSDASGNLLLRGRNTTANDANNAITPGVFLNGFEINPIPEPASLGLCALGCLGLLVARRRRA